MSERMDHAVEANELMRRLALSPVPDNVRDVEWGFREAQIHASLAIAEQLRIANLIALGTGTPESSRAIFVEAPEPWDFGKDRSIHPDIAAALGLTAGQEGEEG